MPLLGFEPTILVFERANTVRALDRAATVICVRKRYKQIKNRNHVHIYVVIHKIHKNILPLN
jgi:hypothetical protein